MNTKEFVEVGIVLLVFPVFEQWVPISQLEFLAQRVRSLFEKECILCYYNDRQDIGLFEIFILGGAKSADMHLLSPSPNGDIPKKQLKLPTQGELYSKKIAIVYTLHKRGEILRYLSKRVLRTHYVYYCMLRALYHKSARYDTIPYDSSI